MLVVGNPPWVTNAELSSLGSVNIPEKTNVKRLRGIDALTGSSNFDIAEYIWIKLLKELSFEQPTIALLCKTSVARNVLQFVWKAGMPVMWASVHRIDADKWFGAAVDACLLSMQIGKGLPCYEANVYPDLQSSDPESVIGVVAGQLIADMDAYRRADPSGGGCPVTWRQGLKHDLASVMELVPVPGGYRNKLKRTVEVEPEFIYPLLKSSDLMRTGRVSPRRSVIVTQRRLGEDTRRLADSAPRLWKYLTEHGPLFEKRKSSIYTAQPPFAIFGIGAYSFAPYKVAISGLYKQPRFRALGPVEGRPVMLDDTCYFVPCHSPEQAALLAGLLNDPACSDVLQSLVFWDAKRPITKRILQRLDLVTLLHRAHRTELLSRVEADLERLLNRPARPGSWPPTSLEDCLLAVSGEGQLALSELDAS
ncbi:MAG: class I SAM-dependent methyltransferase [Dehalococcoidia bacterium]